MELRLTLILFFFLIIRHPQRSTLSSSSAASDVYKRQIFTKKQYRTQLQIMILNPKHFILSLFGEFSSCSYNFSQESKNKILRKIPLLPMNYKQLLFRKYLIFFLVQPH
eukprot:TRINITY_DN15338_c0_g1_i1.p3 TRINITY_DN15338_c0_g1~~TRINITY_DN15338_c0_g1_i1.p3  ORF type:complete len:109 (+),score=0.20 TRINITY_DN15338_c0_g1_i1:50-376(+)